MIGIVLWSEATAGKAVIWCEDQGDLAFYSQAGICGDLYLCTGDWVIFDLELKGDLRLARNIQVLPEPGCPHLAEDLVTASEEENTATALTLVAMSELEHCVDGIQASSAEVRPAAFQTDPPVGIRQDSAALAKVKEGLPVVDVLGPSPAEEPAANVIVFPIDKSGGLRRAQ
ncbi:MAG: hypothetical protein BM558_05890 [Roseobacter sp. MedPE-SW]|nr:MAG: hypothetical protein BM558_05890 [Roseobacter sp. MedPE-SW]